MQVRVPIRQKSKFLSSTSTEGKYQTDKYCSLSVKQAVIHWYFSETRYDQEIFQAANLFREMLRYDQAKKLEELLVLGEVHTGSGLNQELGLQRAGDTRRGSHFKTMRNFISLFSSIVHVLGVLGIDVSNYHERSMSKSLVDDIRSYDFVYMLHLILKVLALTYDLNIALQKNISRYCKCNEVCWFRKETIARYERF
nr:uncharacterized protein LOC117275879 [Nicotiana tomentosiformis]